MRSQAAGGQPADIMTGLTAERISFAGPRGALAGELTYASGDLAGAVLLVGPHPYMGGSMTNPLLGRVAETVADLGCVCLRFDYSGAGQSEGPRVDVEQAMAEFWRTGHAPQDEALLADARAAALWLEAISGLPQIVIGYSFGAYAATAAVIGACTGLVLIAPTLRQHEVVLPAATRIRRKVIVAGQDFATPVGATQAWLSRQPCAGLAVDTFESADHFFKGLEARLANSCAGFCLEQLEGTTA